MTPEQWKLIENAREEYQFEWEDSKYDVACLGFVEKDGSLAVDENTACHAALMDAYRDYGEESFLTIISGWQHQDMTATEDEQKLFIKYMLEESPWSSCFLNPSVEDVLEGHWLLDPEQPANLMSGAGIATRLISEWSHHFRAWVNMVEAGVDKNKAYLFSQVVRGKKGKVYVTSCPGHMATNGYFTKKYLHNFLNKTPDPRYTLGRYNEERTYRNISSIWGGQGGAGYGDFQRISPRSGIIQQNLNIFFNRFKQVKNYGGAYFTTKEEILGLAEDMEYIINQKG